MSLQENPSDLESRRVNAFGQLFREHRQALLRHALKKLGNLELAQDIVQETFVVLWNSDMLNKPDEVRGYLYGIVRHKILDEYRRNAMRLRYANERVNKVEEHYETPDQPLLTKELKKIIDQEIALMPERMREIFQMKKQQKLSIAEIATTLKLSEQTVKNQLYRATNRLKERLLTYDTSMVVIGILLFGLLSYLKD
jgi:RNA polymerase sigma-70 factor (ECF subfamily)